MPFLHGGELCEGRLAPLFLYQADGRPRLARRSAMIKEGRHGLPSIGSDAGGDEGDAGFLPDRLEQRGQFAQLSGRNLGIVQVDEASVIFDTGKDGDFVQHRNRAVLDPSALEGCADIVEIEPRLASLGRLSVAVQFLEGCDLVDKIGGHQIELVE